MRRMRSAVEMPAPQPAPREPSGVWALLQRYLGASVCLTVLTAGMITAWFDWNEFARSILISAFVSPFVIPFFKLMIPPMERATGLDINQDGVIEGRIMPEPQIQEVIRMVPVHGRTQFKPKTIKGPRGEHEVEVRDLKEFLVRGDGVRGFTRNAWTDGGTPQHFKSGKRVTQALWQDLTKLSLSLGYLRQDGKTYILNGDRKEVIERINQDTLSETV